jgi:hypothetical protein
MYFGPYIHNANVRAYMQCECSKIKQRFFAPLLCPPNPSNLGGSKSAFMRDFAPLISSSLLIIELNTYN